MPWTLTYSATLISPTGQSFTWTGQQTVSAATPTANQLTTATQLMQADIATQAADPVKGVGNQLTVDTSED